MNFSDVPTPHDHCHILILVKLHGFRNSDRCSLVLNRIYERIKRVNVVTVSDDSPQRTVSVRYVNSYSSKWNQWGEFQAHRRLLGLLYVATLDSTAVSPRKSSFNSPSDVNSPDENVNLLVGGLLKSRSQSCVAQLNFDKPVNGLIPDSPISTCESPGVDCSVQTVIEQFRSTVDEFKTTLFDSRCFIFGSDESALSNSNFSNGDALNKSYQSAGKGKNVTFYSSLEDCKSDIEGQVKDFVSNLYWILESKRLDRSFEKLTDSLQCPLAPGEEKSRVGLDSRNTKAYRKKAVGRHFKLLADYSLMAGLPALAVDAYGSSIEMLKASNDWLWLAGAYEGLACAATVMRYSQSRSQTFHRVATFSPGQMKSAVTRANQIVGDLVTPRSPLHTPERLSKNAMADSRSFLKEVLTPAEIVERFRMAIENYQKFSFAAFVELDCALKGSRVLIFEHQYLEVADWLRVNSERYLRPAYTLFDSTSKAYVCQTLANLFKEIGFQRKYSFYMRLTAMYKLKLDQDGVNHTQKDFRAVYPLLLAAMDGFGLPLNPKDIPLDRPFGWPEVQTRAMHEVYLAARRGLNYQLAERHLRYLVTYLSDSLPDQMLSSFCQDLTELSCHSSSSSHLQGPGSLLIPPVPLIRTPVILCVMLQPLPTYLAPSVILTPSSTERSSVFIYTPMYSLRRKTAETAWVSNCSSVVNVELKNPLNYELIIENLVLLCDGIQCESVPVSVHLAPLESCLSVRMPLIPKSPGTLLITGFSCEVFGSQSSCRFKDCYELHLPRPVPGLQSAGRENIFSVKVFPPMPLLNVSCDLGRDTSHRLVDHTLLCSTVNVFQGETKHSMLKIHNVSACSTEFVVISVTNPIKNDFERLLDLNIDDVQSQLPLAPGGFISVPIQIFGLYSFSDNKHLDSSESSECPTQLYQIQVKLEYGCYESNSDDNQCKYQRTCSALFNITVVPLLLLKQLNVLPSCANGSRYLMVHVENVATTDLEILVGPDKRLHVGQGDAYRFPVPFEGIVCNSLSVAACQLYLRSSLDIQWLNPVTGDRGILALWPGIQSLEDCRKITLPPMVCFVSFNGRAFEETADYYFGAGELIELTVKMSSAKETNEWPGATVTTVWFQDLQNGRRKVDLSEQLVLVGPTSFLIYKEDFPEKLVQFQLIFLCAGAYRVEIVAELVSGEDVKLTPPIAVNITLS